MTRWVFALFALLWALPASAQNYRFPTTAADYASYYPTAYKDEGGQDWNCGSIFYSGHGGSDFGGGSWAGMDEGRDIVAAAGLSNVPVDPIKSADLNQPAARPAYAPLASVNLPKAGIAPLRPYAEALAECINRLPAD